MKRLLLTLAISVCLLAPIASVSAGDVPIGGYCDSEFCTQSNPAPEGYHWNHEGSVWHLHQN